ncbi:hypothetical protein KSP40_PGU013782 [Platanthera guangdongensis]|uniref:Wall-associated receptor kinase galacturonan-binding domain-containing protein n=1 Tax=Platanthera guangdongensis TaxID=2320717 RepID=A0ABR2MQB0_9ASPA
MHRASLTVGPATNAPIMHVIDLFLVSRHKLQSRTPLSRFFPLNNLPLQCCLHNPIKIDKCACSFSSKPQLRYLKNAFFSGIVDVALPINPLNNFLDHRTSTSTPQYHIFDDRALSGYCSVKPIPSPSFHFTSPPPPQLHPQPANRMGKQSSSSSPSVIHCFIFFISIGFTEELPDQQHCNPSSCGEIQIAYPFRLKGDPQNCGDPNYELTCRGNRAFMEFHSSQYSVKQINYDSKSIQVIEIGLLRSNCSLPLKSLSATSMLRSNYYHLDRWTWIGTMNCSKKLLPQKYQLFPCQSGKDSYLYGVWGYLLIDLAPSCSFFSMMPTSDDLNVQKDLFQAIHEGFSLSWNNQGFTTAMLIRECLRQSSRAGRAHMHIQSSAINHEEFLAIIQFLGSQAAVLPIQKAKKLCQT